jgi:hypothetical protein
VGKRSEQELAKQERSCQEQCHILQALADLAAKERTMFELDHGKDRVMTVCPVSVGNLAM